MINNLIALPGYHLTAKIYESDRTLVYRGQNQENGQAVVVKLMRNEYPSFGELVRFRNQYIMVKNLEIEGIIQSYALERYQNRYALVMEDIGGVSLAKYKDEFPLSITQFLEIALQLANILHQLHQNNIIHKDIKPANILIHPDTQQIKLTDFSISTLLPKETQTLQIPSVLEGTLSYLSPEQTGRMNRGIDYRTDFYSLGITFYELLTGKLPFQSQDLIDLVHCHIAKIPKPIASTAIPPVISNIVMKLMAKNAEDRYQSAWGLKFDLEQCLTQLQQTSKIESFELGTRDITDRFIIPEKLYGRETEIQTLLAAFERVSNPPQNSLNRSAELMLVTGFSGIGKTAVVNEVHKPIVRQHGYFIKGKFDQLQRNIPFSAFVQAFRDLMSQLLSESDAQLQTWHSKILEALGENGQVIIKVIPELERIIGQQPPAPELSGAAVQNRFNLLFQKFISVFTTKEHPLVIFLDDLQWADSASLSLIQVLMGESQLSHLLLIGAYRDNEVSASHPLILTLDDLSKAGVTANTITLTSLTPISLNYLVADTLTCTPEIAQPLSQLVYQKTQGNPFFATQFLKALHQDKLITFDTVAGYWQCDITQVREAALTDDVVQFMARQLQKLPTETQKVLKLAACIGNQFDLTTLAVVSQSSETETATALWQALSEGLILPQSEVYKFYVGSQQNLTTNTSDTLNYRFLHDRVQQAAYSLIPETERAIAHYQIGQLLLQKISPEAQEERTFELVNQLNYGITQIEEQPEKDELAQLNLKASQKARAATAYQAAQEYATVGLKMLGENSWQRQYDMTLSLHNLAAEVAFLVGDFERMEQWIEAVIHQVKTPLEQVPVYQVRIQAMVARNQFLEAITVGQSVFRMLGVNLPDEPTIDDIRLIKQEIEAAIAGRTIESLFYLSKMSDAQQLAIMQNAARLTPVCYMSGATMLYFLIVALQVKLSIQFGNSPVSAFCYVGYAFQLRMLWGEMSQVSQFGQLGYQLALEPDSKDIRAATAILMGAYVGCWTIHLKDTLSILLDGYQTGLETGNVEFMVYDAQLYCFNAYWYGQPLSELEPQIHAYYQQLYNLNQLTTANCVLVYWQATQILLGKSENEFPLRQDAYEIEVLEEAKVDFYRLSFFYLYRFTLNYWLEDFTQAEKDAIQTRQYLAGGMGSIVEPVFYLYDSLTVLATADESIIASDTCWQRIQENQAKLKEWADCGSMNYLHKYYLVEAEKHRVFNRKAEAIEFYDLAIQGAKENGYVQEEGLANELAAKFYWNWGKEKVASGYLQEAYYCYSRWEATAKIINLEENYPQLLAPILQQPRPTELFEETLATVRFSNTINNTTSTHSSNSIYEAIDLATLLQASQAISGEIELDKLVGILLEIVRVNAGADKCVLLLQQEQDLKLVGLLESGQQLQILTSIPLSVSEYLPMAIVNQVKRTLTPIVLADARIQPQFVSDSYLEKRQPKSVLCSPILNQGQLIGILYLENKLIVKAFTKERVDVLNMLAAQAAISIENAQLYERSREYSQQLERSLAELSIAESNLRASQQRLQLFVQQTPLAVIEWDSNFQITDWNPAAEKIFGYTKQEALGRHFRLIIPPAIQAEIEKVGIDLILQQGGTYYINENVTKDGKTIVCAWYNSPLIDTNGELIGVASLADDITDRQKAELALQQQSQNLQQALQDLQQAQLQLIQSEKMSALGNLVAGVAHEINNPVGFLSGNIPPALDYINDLLGLLDLIQEKYPELDSEVEAEIEAIELDYIREDLPKLVSSMQEGIKRIREISTSLRTFSRDDQDYPVACNIHQGLDSTILILKHRLKANEKRPEILAIKNYGDLPLVECYAGQLNQVFMNILSNAIEALEESNESKAFDEIKANPNQITVTTSVENNQAKISITDNGNGMSDAVKAKIFDHLFTTKAVGKGTGLGMAIAQQIITEKHRGTITCKSELGRGTTLTIAIPISQ
ncbi:MAG: AAA family ATPase [Jaaginema sp. PMC 1079.18]|nr:AAA family ATPase [Jaaginema sp. PMC 1080.18]MEC4851807.1 AAA family ATPase [Jaaginema sp. PMC 1079.18]MEC4868359.1 AAA family ATPase [Jaaginema sp. PMC 1078.18]